MTIRYRCPHCNAVQEAPDHSAGAKVACPSCGQRLQLPARPPSPGEAGEGVPVQTSGAGEVPVAPIRVQVSAKILQWPVKCACCCEEADAVLQVTNLHRTGSGSDVKEVCREVTYCKACLAHVKSPEGAGVKEACCGARPAVAYDGYRGAVHTFRFFNRAYAERFLKANQKKVLNLPG
jgi:hypothetical protein